MELVKTNEFGNRPGSSVTRELQATVKDFKYILRQYAHEFIHMYTHLWYVQITMDGLCKYLHCYYFPIHNAYIFIQL